MKSMNTAAFFQKHRAGVVVFAFAVLVRLAIFFVYLDAHHGDFIGTIRAADGYYEISRNLIDGNGYSDSSGPAYPPNALRPPAWIFIIAIIAGTFGSYAPVLIFELVLAGFIPVIGMYLADKIAGKRVGIFTGIFLTFEPNLVFNSIWLASETCFTFLFLIFSLFVFRYADKQTIRNAVWSGVFLALAMLVKPTVQFLPVLVPVLAAYIYRKQFRLVHLKHILLFVIACVLVVAPWLYRNYREFGRPSLSSQAAFNLYTVLVPTVLALDNGTTFEAERAAPWFRDSVAGVNITPANAGYFTHQALLVVAQHKVALVKSAGISVFTFFTHDGMLTVLGYAGVTIPNFLDKPVITLLFTDPLKLFGYILRYAATPGLFIFLGRILWVLTTVLFFFGAWRYCKKERVSAYALYALFVVAYFALTTAANGFGMNARFRLPVQSFIVTFAFYGLFALRSLINSKWFPRDA